MKWKIISGVILVGAGIVMASLRGNPPVTATLQKAAKPGPLSSAHAFMGNNCAACHTTRKGPDDAKCIACHANNESLLQRAPTRFHASIDNCAACHAEHQGNVARPAMDHAALAKIGLRELGRAPTDSEQRLARRQVMDYLQRVGPGAKAETGLDISDNPHITALEGTLNCAACHGTKDKHQKLFGPDCAACHSTTRWTVPEFRHPSPRSMDCAQCHQAPPSHYMMHFKMISQKIASQESAPLGSCFICHQTTSWNDIKGVGWYKHH
jgi:hypothetical protein